MALAAYEDEGEPIGEDGSEFDASLAGTPEWATFAGHTFHDPRHTAASLALQAGVPLWKVSNMLGHRDLATTQRIYAHLVQEGREGIAEVMHAVLSEAPKGRTVVRMAWGPRMDLN